MSIKLIQTSFAAPAFFVVLMFAACSKQTESPVAPDSNTNSTVATSPSPLSSPSPLLSPSPSLSPSPHTAKPGPTKTAAAPQPEARHYKGVGIVTKIVTEPKYGNEPSVELNHEEIEGLMPAMIMEFYVKDKALLNNLKVGDKVEFTIEEKGGSEIISAIKGRQ